MIYNSVNNNCACNQYEFTLSSIDTTGPDGVVVPVLVSSFGVSPDTYIISVSGNDMRERLYFENTAGPDGVTDFPNPNYGGWLSKNAAMYSADGSCDTLYLPNNTYGQNNYIQEDCSIHGACVQSIGYCSNTEENIAESDCVGYGNCTSHDQDTYWPMQVTSSECEGYGGCLNGECSDTGTCSDDGGSCYDDNDCRTVNQPTMATDSSWCSD